MDTFTVAMESSPMTTALMNQWPSECLLRAMDYATIVESARRADINSTIVGGIRLSVRPDAVLRDIQRACLGACAPAGVA